MKSKINPQHYRQFEKEVIEIIFMSLTLDEFIGFLKGNIIKYSLRAGWKDDGETDLKKRNWYQLFLKKIQDNLQDISQMENIARDLALQAVLEEVKEETE